MTVLVLGPNGQLGAALLAAAGERGIPGVAAGRDAVDLARPDAIAAALDPFSFDVLVNCAAVHGTDRIETDAALARAAFDVNGRAPGALADACRRREARLVHLSSDYVFDGEAGRPYREEDPPGPVNVYGASKLLGEALVRREHSEGTIVVRTASLFGRAAPGHGGTSFVDRIVCAAREGRPLRVVDDIVMSPTFAPDLARGILDLLQGGAPAGTYHLVNAGEASWWELAVAALEAAGVPDAASQVDAVPAAAYGMAAARPRYSVLDAGRAREFTELRGWREAVAEVGLES